MKNCSAISKLLALLLCGSMTVPQIAWALPQGGVVTHGNANFNYNGNELHVNQGSDRAVINWQEFNIGAEQMTQYHQPSASSAVLNRVVGGNMSDIQGALRANGNVFVINQAGIVVGANASIDVNGLVLSTKDVLDNEFMAGGDMNFFGESHAAIVNAGTIKAINGDVFLIAREIKIENTGKVQAANGTVGMAATSGDVLLKAAGQERLFINGGSALADGKTALDNAGVIEAVQAELKAYSGNPYALAIKNTGRVHASGVESKDGRILLVSKSGNIDLGGELTAQNKSGSGGYVKIQAAKSNDPDSKSTLLITGKINLRGDGGAGGSVILSSENIALLDGAEIDASGKTGGGMVLIGGDYQGQDSVHFDYNASRVFIDQNTAIKADALESGDGGRIIAWADEGMWYYGSLSAKGGEFETTDIEGNPIYGNGGFAEVSGRDFLDFQGFVDLSAVNTNGLTGTLLLDPTDIIITNAATLNLNNVGNVFTNNVAPGGTSILNILNLTNALASANVTVTTFGPGVAPLNGTITLADSFSWTGNNSLTLQANNNIILNSGVSVSAAGSMIMNASNSVFLNGNLTNSSIIVDAGTDIHVSGNLRSTVTSGNGIILRAAGNNINGTGTIRFNSPTNIISTAGGILSLVSGLGSIGRADFSMVGGANGYGGTNGIISLDSSSGSFGGLAISGFRDVSLITTNSALTSATFNVVAQRDLFINTGLTALSGGNDFNLFAAGGDINQTGTVRFTQPSTTISANSLKLFRIRSGVSTNGQRADFGMLNGSDGYGGSNGLVFLESPDNFREITILGFRDVSLTSTNTVISSLTYDVRAQRDLFVNRSLTALSGGNSFTLHAAGGDINGTGTVRFTSPSITLSGDSGGGVKNLNIVSGVSTNGQRADFNILNGSDGYGGTNGLVFLETPNNFGTLTIQGFRDVSLTTTNSVLAAQQFNVVAQRDLFVNRSLTAVSGGNTFTLHAAGGDINGTGTVRFTQPSIVLSGDSGGGAKILNIVSGVSTNGQRADFSMLNGSDGYGGTNGLVYFNTPNNLGRIVISGFRDISIEHEIPGTAIRSGAFDIIAQRDLLIRSDLTYLNNNNGIELRAAGGDVNSTGTVRFTQSTTLLSQGSAVAGDIRIFSGLSTNGTRADFGVVNGANGYGGTNGLVLINNFNAASTHRTINIQGFRDANIQSSDANNSVDLAGVFTVVADRDISFRSSASTLFSLGANNSFLLNANTVNTYNNSVLSALTDGSRITLNVINDHSLGGVTNSYVNVNAFDLNIASAAGGETVINESDNVNIINLGGASQNGNITLNARGDITFAGTLTKNAASTANITLRADAAEGEVRVTGGDVVKTNLNTIFGGTIGGDGFGTVYGNNVSVALLPRFVLPMVYTGPNFTYTVGGPGGTNVTIVGGTLNTLPNNEKQRLLQILGLSSTNGAAGAANNETLVALNATGSSGGFSPFTSLVAAGLQPLFTTFQDGGQDLYAIGSYTYAQASGLNYSFTSMGLGFNSATASSTTINRTSYFATGENAGNILDTTVYNFGNIVEGSTANLFMSGQFYKLDGTASAIPTNVSYGAPPSGFQADNSGWFGYTPNNSIQVGNANLTILSGPNYASGPRAGEASDLNLFINTTTLGIGSNAAANLYPNTFRLTSLSGSVTVLGYRDILVSSNGALVAGNGTITLGAARDIIARVDVGASANANLTLLAGNMIVTTNGAVIGGTAGGGSNLVLMAGKGVNVESNFRNLSGGIQDNVAAYTGSLAGGIAPTGTFVVSNRGSLTIGTYMNPFVAPVTFSDTGLQYGAGSNSIYSGLLSTSTLGTASVDGSIFINTTTAQGGNITVLSNIRSMSNVTLNAQRGASVADNFGSIIGAGGRVSSSNLITLNSANFIGSSDGSARLLTDANTLVFTSGVNVTPGSSADVYIGELNDMRVSGVTLTNNGRVDILVQNAGKLTVNTNGITAHGSGLISLVTDNNAATGVSDVGIIGTVRSGSGSVTIRAGQLANGGGDILNEAPGVLASGEANTSTNLNVATLGNISLLAGNSVGAMGQSLALWTETQVFSESRGFNIGGTEGTYITLLDTLGGVTFPGPVLFSITSAQNVDVHIRASNIANTGSAATGGAIASANNGYIRLVADRDLGDRAHADGPMVLEMSVS